MHWHCWLGGRKGIQPVKNGDGGGGHWLVRMEWRPAGLSVCLPLLIFPCTIKSRSSLLALGGPGKRPVNGCGGGDKILEEIWIQDRRILYTTMLNRWDPAVREPAQRQQCPSARSPVGRCQDSGVRSPVVDE